jgi:hypothetical protein
MRFLFRLVMLALLACIGFYAIWPAFSGYQIYTALASQDAARLASKIDFDSVREGLRPAVTGEVERQFTQNAGGNLPPQIRQQLVPQLVETTLNTLVTPENVMRIYREGGDVRRSVTNILREKMAAGGGLPGIPGLPGLGGNDQSSTRGVGALGIPGGLGGLGQLAEKLGGLPGKSETPAPAPAKPSATPDASPSSFGVGNIKTFGFAGPFGIELGVARNAQTADADLTARMEFRDSDWKLTRLVPRL